MHKVVIVVAAVVGVLSGVAVNKAFAKEPEVVRPLARTCKDCNGYRCVTGPYLPHTQCTNYTEGCAASGTCI